MVTSADSVLARRMLSMLSVAPGVPVEPPCPVLVDADATTLRFNVLSPSWPAGRPPVVSYELQYGKRYQMGWDALPHLIPSRLQPRLGAPEDGGGGAGDSASVSGGTLGGATAGAGSAALDPGARTCGGVYGGGGCGRVQGRWATALDGVPARVTPVRVLCAPLSPPPHPLPLQAPPSTPR